MKSNHRVLWVEDDHLIAKSLKMGLPYQGIDVAVCKSYRDGLEQFKTQPFDAVLLDINLPDGNGIDLCSEIRKVNPAIPILLVTAKTDEATAVAGFEKGADDYVRKPFGLLEVASRIKKLIEKSSKVSAIVSYGTLKMDPLKRQVWIHYQEIHLGNREFEILWLLINRPGEPITRSDILGALHKDQGINDRTVDSHLSHLRKKIKEAQPATLQIVPVYGVGYKLEKIAPQ